MQEEVADEITALLEKSCGQHGLTSLLVERLYPELKRIAECRMRRERNDHTLQPTELVNEVFLALARRNSTRWLNRAHFLSVASRAMRQILIDYARRRKAAVHGGGLVSIPLDDLQVSGRDNFVDVLELGELLDRLAKEEPRLAQVLEMRFFGGLTYEEIGEALGFDPRTAKRDWHIAEAWLFGQLSRRNQ